ncbi:hypothetical protein CW731_14305 [Polaribacter sp. ALD11]|uniref:hypothetical protein n=1 Tax=Polaribacter sp. ALD11 TaxID=2058137 RepID=UPI000C30DA61|nr:hypothetical protein [Polaribacter sp. ALD11]AUC86379.1 hypothetical protein CW731_14305 [Polaribacter sp. ALD11]
MKDSQNKTELDRGILTSSYKEEVKRDPQKEKRKSISRIKSLILNHQGKIESQIGVILQVFLFVLAITMI